jgi:solute carrier family 6 (neurotransmitter transporter, GABA) member 1
VVGHGKNWKIPVFWSVLLRYVSGPVLAIIFSFAYPEFYTLRYDPMMIAGFILAHLGLLLILLGFVMPRYYDVFIPVERRNDVLRRTLANQPLEGIAEESVIRDVNKETSGV